MNRIVLVITFCISLYICAFSQKYQLVEWDIYGVHSLYPISNTTDGIPVKSDFDGTMAVSTELRFNVTNRMSLGFKLQGQFFNEIFEEAYSGLGLTSSYGFTGDYYLKNSVNKRAFVGLGIASFDNEGTSVSGDLIGGTGLGLTPRIGYKYKLLRFTAEYNHTLEEDFPNYFAFGLSINVGGRYK